MKAKTYKIFLVETHNRTERCKIEDTTLVVYVNNFHIIISLHKICKRNNKIYSYVQLWVCSLKGKTVQKCRMFRKWLKKLMKTREWNEKHICETRFIESCNLYLSQAASQYNISCKYYFFSVLSVEIFLSIFPHHSNLMLCFSILFCIILYVSCHTSLMKLSNLKSVLVLCQTKIYENIHKTNGNFLYTLYSTIIYENNFVGALLLIIIIIFSVRRLLYEIFLKQLRAGKR